MASNKETIKLSDLSLKEKVGQLIICRPHGFDQRYVENLKVGGIFLSKQSTKKEYKEMVNFYDADSKIDLFKALDLEGYINELINFYNSRRFDEISNGKESYSLGKEHARVMNEIGFNLNFSPIVEIRNNVWPGRTFMGNKKEIASKIKKYIEGIHSEGIMATAKHYPGGTLVKDPHWFKFKVKTTEDEQEMFDTAIDSNVDAVMIGHPITYGAVDSGGKQVTVSKEAISKLRKKFDGLIITDDVNMMGLLWSYIFSFNQVYVDSIKAGNDIVLDTGDLSSYNRVRKRIEKLLKAIRKGEISEERINESVKRVLKAKGYNVKK